MRTRLWLPSLMREAVFIKVAGLGARRRTVAVIWQRGTAKGHWAAKRRQPLMHAARGRPHKSVQRPIEIARGRLNSDVERMRSERFRRGRRR